MGSLFYPVVYLLWENEWGSGGTAPPRPILLVYVRVCYGLCNDTAYITLNYVISEWMMNWTGCERQRSWHSFVFYPGICVEKLMKFNDKLSHFNWPLSEDFQVYHVCWTQHETFVITTIFFKTSLVCKKFFTRCFVKIIYAQACFRLNRFSWNLENPQIRVKLLLTPLVFPFCTEKKDNNGR
jgi:hypothetical protein